MPEPVLGPDHLNRNESKEKSTFSNVHDSISDMPDPILSKYDIAKQSSPVRKSAFSEVQENNDESDEPEPI